MDYVTSAPKKIVGVSVVTENADDKAQYDIMMLWQRFMAEDIMVTVQDRLSDTIYSVYHSYDTDEHGPYTVTLGVEVPEDFDCSQDMDIIDVPEQKYAVFPLEGVIPDVIIDAWEKIWAMDADDLDRAYAFDFEVYGPDSLDANDAKLDILISVKD